MLRSINLAAQAGAFTTEEEALARTFAQIGPVVAIGQPGEPPPDPGAARTYVSDATWQGREFRN